MYNEEYYLALLIKKEEIVKREFGQMPHEAIGISEEHYRNLKISSRYSRLCEVIKINSNLVEKPINGLKMEIDQYRAFLRAANNDEREKVQKIISRILSKNDKRKQLQEEINMKRKELEKLEAQIQKT